MLFVENFYVSAWMVLSAFLYSLQNVDARFSGNLFGFWTMCVFRGVVGTIICACLLRVDGKKHSMKNLRFLVLRSILGGATIIASFFAILKCGLSTTTVITSTSSLWTALIGYIISPQKYKWAFYDIVIALWCIVGVVVLSLNNHNQNIYHYIGITSALLSAIFQSGVNLTIKHLDQESPAWIALWGMLGSVGLGLPGCIYEIHKAPHFSRATPIEYTSLLTTGVLSAMAQYCKTYSIQISGSMSVLIFRYMDVMFSVLWDVFLFKERLQWQTITGIVIILIGCLTKISIENLSKSVLLPINKICG